MEQVREFSVDVTVEHMQEDWGDALEDFQGGYPKSQNHQVIGSMCTTKTTGPGLLSS